MLRVLHIAPHPDDELLGAPATLMALRAAGHHISNFPCSLGRPEDQERRLKELQEACRRADFELIIPEVFSDISSKADPQEATEETVEALRPYIEGFDLFVSPSPGDAHPGHEAVGRAVRSLLGERDDAVWWQWGLWADLPMPSLMYSFSQEEVQKVLWALQAHVKELERNDYGVFWEGRARMNSVLGPERIWGFGSSGTDAFGSELLQEVYRKEGCWMLAPPRELDPRNPFKLDSGPLPAFRGGQPWLDVTEEVEAPSFLDRLRNRRETL